MCFWAQGLSAEACREWSARRAALRRLSATGVLICVAGRHTERWPTNKEHWHGLAAPKLAHGPTTPQKQPGTMGSRAVQYRAPQYDVDASQQTYLVQKLRPVQDPRAMPRVIGGPDWSPAASRVGKAFRVAAPNGATVRAGAALDSREVCLLYTSPSPRD